MTPATASPASDTAKTSTRWRFGWLVVLGACLSVWAVGCGDDSDATSPTNNSTTGTNTGTTSTNNATTGSTTSTNNATTSTNNATTSTNNASTGTNNSTTSTNNSTTSTNNSTTSTNNNTTGGPVCGDGRCDEGEDCPEDCAPPCVYPAEAAQYPIFDRVMPNVSWEGVFTPDGTQIDFSMESFYCDAEYDRYQTMLLFVTSGWCPACPEHIRRIDAIAAELEAAGMMIVYLEAEDAGFNPSTHAGADDHISRLIGDGIGLRIGDGETRPEPSQIAMNLSSRPFVSIVRRSDMKVITDWTRTTEILPLLDIAEAPDDDWSAPPAGPVESVCGPEDEEDSEPDNDTPQTAPTIGLGSFEGGICSNAPDYFRVDIDGIWRLDLEFSHAIGDLDVFVWDEETNAIDEAHGSASESDNEALTYEGPAVVMVYGFELARAPYTLTITEQDALCEFTEEDSEPDNNAWQTAPLIQPGTFDGSICDAEFDFYRIESDGTWRVDLEFLHAIGDLDMGIWDTERDEVLDTHFSNSATDNESLTYEGNATIVVGGYGLARAPYTLTFTETSSACDAAWEEGSEPENDAWETAPTIAQGGFEGGLCGPQSDFFRVDIDGPWQFTVEYDSDDMGDPDLRVWRTDVQEPYTNAEGEAVTSTSSSPAETRETVMGNGPAIVEVFKASPETSDAPYVVLLFAF